jgi:hypothetical protein
MDKDTVYTYRTVIVPPNAINKCPKGGKGKITFRITRPKKDFTGFIEVNNEATVSVPFRYSVSVAVCSPLDNFSKRAARSLTDARAFMTMDSKGSRFTYKFESKTKMTIDQVVKHMLNKAIPTTKELVPRWFFQSTVAEPEPTKNRCSVRGIGFGE